MAPNISRDGPTNMNIWSGGPSLQHRSRHIVALKPNHLEGAQSLHYPPQHERALNKERLAP